MTDQTTGASREALFCIGSNCGDRELNVASALDWLSGLIGEFRHSLIYATPDCHGGQREYMNAVALGTTELNPDELDCLCKEFELSKGRDAAARKAGDVPVDLDLVVYDGTILRKRDYDSEFFLKGFRMIKDKACPSCDGD